MRLLAVAPHPDDEVIGCGGLIHKWNQAGARTTVLWVYSPPTPEQRADAERAVAVLGVQETIGLGLPPAGLSYDEPTLKRFVSAFRRARPDVVLLPHRDDDDESHRTAHRLGAESVWLAGYPIWPEEGETAPRASLVLEYEVWSPLASPNYIEDIRGHLRAKLRALRCYRHQLSISRLDQAVAGLNRYRGRLHLGVPCAEAFFIKDCRMPLIGRLGKGTS